MAKPVDVRNLTDLAQAIAAENPSLDATQVQAAFEAAIANSEPLDVNVVGGSSVPFDTETVAVPAPPAVTQLPSLPCPNGIIIRADEDMDIYNNGTPTPTDGFRVYEGDDIRMTTVTNLNQVYVKPTKNAAITVWAMTL